MTESFGLYVYMFLCGRAKGMVGHKECHVVVLLLCVKHRALVSPENIDVVPPVPVSVG